MGLYSEEHRGKFRWLPVIVIIVFGAFYYLGNRENNPYTGRKQMITMSTEDEAALGLESYRQVLRDGNVMLAGPEVEVVKRIGQKLAAGIDESNFQWEFNVLDSSQANAFCLPGGKVAVYLGLLKVTQNEDALAVVMGHEIAHALARHGAERMAHQQLAQFGQMALQMATGDMDYQQRRAIMGAFGIGTQYGILLPFSREHESEADHLGLKLAAKACFDPQEAPRFWKRMGEASSGQKPPELLSTHPSDQTRIEQLNSWLPEALEEQKENCKIN